LIFNIIWKIKKLACNLHVLKKEKFEKKKKGGESG